MAVAKEWNAWSPEDELLLEKLRFNERKTIKECARIMGRTYRSIDSKVNEKKLWRPSPYMSYIPLLTQPHTLDGVAALMKVPKYTVKKAKQALQALGIKMYKCPNTGAFKPRKKVCL